MLPVPLDWNVESIPPTNWYQHCLPETFRYINLVTDTEDEINAIFNNSRPATTDFWETIHIQAMTSEWDYEGALFKTAGFGTIVTSDMLSNYNGNKEFESTLGYFDEGRSPMLT